MMVVQASHRRPAGAAAWAAAAPATPTCTACGQPLSRYNPGDVCAACARASAPPAPEVFDGEHLLFAVASILFGRPNETVDVRHHLELRGVWASHVETWQAVQKLRRRGCVIEATPREPGYRLTAWRPKWRRNRRSSNAT